MSLNSSFPGLLRMSRRDIRIACNKITSPGLLRSAGVVKFANALFKRYTDRDWLEPARSFVLMRSRIGVTIQLQHRYQQFNLTPRIALTVLTWMPRSNHSDPSTPVPLAARARLQPDTQGIKTVVWKRKTYFVEQLMDQIITQKRRVEITSTPSLAGPPVAQIPEVKYVVRHAIPSLTDQALLTPPGEQKREAKSPERKTFHPLYETADAPIDINRLTDQVIQKIDHRIIAQRERLGRI